MSKLGPKQADHPSVGIECLACHQPFVAGDYTTLVTLGPGDNEDAQQRRDQGRPYNAIALEIHWACSTQAGE